MRRQGKRSEKWNKSDERHVGTVTETVQFREDNESCSQRLGEENYKSGDIAEQRTTGGRIILNIQSSTSGLT